MTNFQVYKKVLPFSLIQFLVNFASLLVFAGLCVGGFFLGEKLFDSKAFIGLAIGFILGIVIAILVNIFISNRIKAAQIAMMAKGVTEGNLPEHTVKEGFNEIKGRFGKITVFFFITGAIKGIFRQIGRVINKIGTAVGGNTGNAITSTIDSAVQTVVGYLCDCCLGWILVRKDQNAARAGCEGAIIFFKHGKTLIRNIGRIFGMGLLSLLLIGGAFFGIFCAIFLAVPKFFEYLVAEIADVVARNGGGDIPEFFQNPTYLALVAAALFGIIMWTIIHSVFIRPFILTGVMRNFMAAGQQNMPTEQDFAELSNKSPKFAKLANKDI